MPLARAAANPRATVPMPCAICSPRPPGPLREEKAEKQLLGSAFPPQHFQLLSIPAQPLGSAWNSLFPKRGSLEAAFPWAEAVTEEKEPLAGLNPSILPEAGWQLTLHPFWISGCCFCQPPGKAICHKGGKMNDQSSSINYRVKGKGFPGSALAGSMQEVSWPTTAVRERHRGTCDPFPAPSWISCFI